MSSVYILASLPQFRGVPVSSVQDLLRRAPLKQLEEGEVLFRQGEPAQDAYLLVSGGFSAQVGTKGESREVGTCSPGEIIGESAIFVPEGRRSATLVATAPTVCMALTPRLLREDAEHPALIALEAWLLRSLARRLRGTSQAIQRGWAEREEREHGSKPSVPSRPVLTNEERNRLRGPDSRRALLRQLFDRGGR